MAWFWPSGVAARHHDGVNMMRNIVTLMQVIALSVALTIGSPASAGGASLWRPVVLPVAQMAEEEHDHDHDHAGETDSDPLRNMAAPVLMIAAGLLYLGFVRWQTGRRRGAVSRPR